MESELEPASPEAFSVQSQGLEGTRSNGDKAILMLHSPELRKWIAIPMLFEEIWSEGSYHRLGRNHTPRDLLNYRATCLQMLSGSL